MVDLTEQVTVDVNGYIWVTWHMISCNLHLKSSAKNGGSNWVLIQGAIFTIISGLLSLPSCFLGNEVDKKASN